jgi:hypothetical protein
METYYSGYDRIGQKEWICVSGEVSIWLFTTGNQMKNAFYSSLIFVFLIINKL